MVPSLSRRQVLTSCTSGVAALTGCSALSSESTMVNLVMYNRSEKSYEVSLRFHHPDDQFRGDSVARILVVIGPAEEVRRENIVERQPYIVQYDVYTKDGGFETDDDHIHFFPRDSDDASVILDIESSGKINQRR